MIDKEQFENLLLATLPASEPDRNEWILLQENSLEITKAHKAANKSLAVITELHSLCGIDSFDKLFEAQNNVKAFIHSKMMESKTLRTLAENIDINLLTVPAGLQRAEVLLANTFDKQFLFFENSEWQIDLERLVYYLEQFRFYAKTPEQKKKLELTQSLVEYLNQIGMGVYSKHAFVNSMIQIALTPEGTYGFQVDTNWIISKNDSDYKN